MSQGNRTTPKDPISIGHRGRERKLVIAIEDMPEEFIAALGEPVNDPELAALDHLLDA